MRVRVSRGANVVDYGIEVSGLGCFCTVSRDGRKVAEYDALRPDYDGLPGLLRLLVSTGVVDEEAVVAAVQLLPRIEAVDEIDHSGTRFVAGVILRCRPAATA